MVEHESVLIQDHIAIDHLVDNEDEDIRHELWNHCREHRNLTKDFFRKESTRIYRQYNVSDHRILRLLVQL